MTGSVKIGNPLGAYGQAPTPMAIVEECICGAGGLTRGDLVTITYSVTTGRLTATRAATAEVLTARFGVAEASASAGMIVKVTLYGPTFVNGGVNTFAVGEAIFRSAATAGHANRLVPDATTIVGQCAGTVLGVKSAVVTDIYPFVNAVPVFIEKF